MLEKLCICDRLTMHTWWESIWCRKNSRSCHNVMFNTDIIKILTLCVEIALLLRQDLRGCLSKNRPLNFAWKIILPETLASERRFIETITKIGLLWFTIIFWPRWGAPSILSRHGHFARHENWKFGIFCGAVKCLICTIYQWVLYLFIGKHL